MEKKTLKTKRAMLIRKLIAGAVCGVANGFFGAGGGMIAVPALEKLLGMPPEKAHASAICVILPLTVISAAVYVINGRVEWNSFLFVAPAFFAAGIAGAKLLGKLNALWLNRIFSLLMAVAAVWMII